MRNFILVWAIIWVGNIMGVATANSAILDIQQVTSPKGISAWLVQDKTVPVVAMRFAFRGAGAVNDTAELQGLSQMLSNTMDEGAGDMDSKAFQSALENHSISLSFSSGRDDFGGSMVTLTKYQDTAFALLNLAVTKPRFDSDAVGRMQNANLSRLRGQMSDPSWMMARLTNAVVFADHPYAQNSGGTLSSLARITPEILRKKFQSELGRDRLVVAAAGNISAQQLGIALDRIFGDMPATSDVVELTHTTFKNSERALYRKDIPQTFITIVLPAIDRSNPDFATAQVMDFILGSSGFGSRLTEIVREKNGLTYGIYSGLSNQDYADLLTISTSTKNESADEVLSLTQDVLTDMAKNKVTEAEIKNAKSYLIGSVPLNMTSNAEIADIMIGLLAAGLPADYLDKREAALRRVTTDDVLRVAKRLLKDDKRQTILVGNPAMDGVSDLRLVTTLPDVK